MSDVKHYTPVATIDARTGQPIAAMGSDCGSLIGGDGFFVKLKDHEQLQARCAELEAVVASLKAKRSELGRRLDCAQSEKAELDIAAKEFQKSTWRLAGEKAEQQEWFANWEPTTENINALPEKLRQYVVDLETQCDPARMVAENTLVKDNCRMLEQRYFQQQERIAEYERVLQRIANPIWALENDAIAEGNRLDGTMAVSIASDAETLRQWAEDALPTPHPAEQDIKPYWMDESEWT